MKTSTTPVVLFAQNTTSFEIVSSAGSHGLNGAPTQFTNQNCIGHSSPSSIPPPSVSGLVQSVPVWFSIASGIPSPSKSSASKSSLGSFSGFVPSKYSELSSTPPPSVSVADISVTQTSREPFEIPIQDKSQPVVTSK